MMALGNEWAQFVLSDMVERLVCWCQWRVLELQRVAEKMNTGNF